MMSEWTLCNGRPAWAVAGLCILAAAASTGCSAPKKQGSMGTLTTTKQFNEVSITYRTESDRVNLAAAGYAGTTQMVSFQQPSPGVLPNVTTATLQIQHPHPHASPGYARACVIVRPNGAEESTEGSFWSRLMGGTDGQNAGNHNEQIIEAWLLDIPAWQVNGIMTRLQDQNFFRRAKVLDAEAFLAVKADGVGFGKDYRAVPELDALILRTRREGRSAFQPSYGPAQPSYGSAQPTYNPVPPTYGPPQPTYGPTHGYTSPAPRIAPPAPSVVPPMTRWPSPIGAQTRMN